MQTNLNDIKAGGLGRLAGLAMAVTFLFAANVQADMVGSRMAYSYEFTTAGGEGWSYASILEQGGSIGGVTYSNPTYNNGTYGTTGTTWSQVEANLMWDTLTWNDAAVGTHWNWDNLDGWIGAPTGPDHTVPNGFYAYNYAIQASDYQYGQSIQGALNLNIMSDDYVAGIYVKSGNDYVSIYEDAVTVGGAVHEGWKGTYAELSFNDIILSAEGLLELIFVVHNTDTAGLFGYRPVNPMGLNINGTFVSNIAFDLPPSDPNAVPEPATLAILGLGLAGLGLARARATRRKT